MSVQRFSFILMIFVILIPEFCVMAIFGEVSKSEAASALTDAEMSVVSAYRAVLDAEQAGANVTGSLGQLNEAEGNLTLARRAYNRGDFEKVADFASSSKNIAEEVHNAAVDLKNSASRESAQRMRLTVIGSIAGVVAVSLGSFGVWRVLKRRYYGRDLRMKSGVSSYES